MHRSFDVVVGPTGPVSWLGANFWSRAGGPLMWRSYDPDLVREELAVLAEHGLGMTRSFFYWPDFMPTPTTVDEELCTHYADFLNAHAELGMTTIPTFLVGHMSGENWDPVWRGGRDLYTDVWLVGRQAWYVATLTARYAEHPAVAGWLISNEMPIYGGEGRREDVAAWAQLMVHAVRAGGGHQPVSIGDGAWGIEQTGHDNGYSTVDLGRFVDFTGPHVYRMETDQVRQHLKAAYVCELAAVGGRPVVMEEFGLSSDFVSPAGAAAYYRQLLHTTLLAGATGWIAWNNTDYDTLLHQRPYTHHPFELHFGVTTSTGEPKPPLLELARFATTLREIDVRTCRRAEAQAALVVPSHLAADYPFTNEVERALIVRTGEQAYIAAREADLPVGVVREATDGGLPAGYDLYLLPSVKQLTGPSWVQVLELAESGATVYASYCAGESPVQRGPWWIRTEELFGVLPELAYGLNDPIADDEVVLTVEAELGSLRPGDVLRFRVAGTTEARAHLPVTVTDGTVVARDAQGRPAIVVKEHGPGRAVLCTYPVEYLASAQGRVNPEETWRLYDALATLAGIDRPVRVPDDPRVLADRLVQADGREVVVLVSEHPDGTTVTPTVTGGLETLDGTRVESVDLEPYGVAVLRRTR
ncbi:cellulase family glycosylhydrolase [Cellulomonas fengjieae]|uniref:cellulase family glycosylhydrolase n=1 Tax=Cellulomonas fengjieae TaxID=2819978 RepID=UPI001AAEDA70|nr:cellulase family glycosylhydrolase [Cellulomonas fengjieae]MBO3103673.1 cellulase family glycosylhydrolase [Cellulomonas fengjieae]